MPEDTDSNTISNKTDSIIEERLMPKLDAPDRDERDSYENIDFAQRELAKQYKKWGSRFARDTVILLTILFVIDWYIVSFNPQIYGLTVNILGGLYLAFPALGGRYTITLLSESGHTREKIEIHARQTVFTNIGFALLALGFALQLLALHPPDVNVIPIP